MLLAACSTTSFPRLSSSTSTANGGFAQVGSLPTVACAGLAAVDDVSAGGTLLLAANYYGASAVFAVKDTHAAVDELQRVPPQAGLRMTHDWEVARVDEATTLLIAAGDGHSLVYLLRAPNAPELPAVELPCADSEEAACPGWASSGECSRNAEYMQSACALSCRACATGDEASMPLRLVQRLETRGAAAAQHIAHGGRHFLALATAADPGIGVVVLEWRRGQWRPFHSMAVRGIAEFCSCPLPSGGHLVGLATWHSGSFSGETKLYTFDPEKPEPFAVLQALPSHGAHDLECVEVEGEEGGAKQLLLLLVNARDDHSRAVPTLVYRYDGGTRRFEEVQRLQTLGAHDVEVMRVEGRLLLAIANQGDGVDCASGSLEVYEFDAAARRFALLQRLRSGCATYAASFRHAGGKLRLAVAVERTGSDEKNQSSYHAASPIYEWVPRTRST